MNLAIQSPAAAIAYVLWLRGRWLLGGIVLVVAALAVAVRFASTIDLAIVGTLVVSVAGAFLLNVLTFGPADIGSRASAFPRHMFVLPMSTPALVGWPIFFGALTTAAIWIALCVLVLKPTGMPAPILWPAALLIAGTAWVQAVSWAPFPSPYIRVPALAVGLTPLLLAGSCIGLFFDSPMAAAGITVASLVWAGAAYWFGVRGVSRARAGGEGDLLAAIGRAFAWRLAQSRSAGRDRPPFRSAARAQLWYECRRNAFALPLMMSFIGFPLVMLAILPLLNSDPSKNLLFGAVVVSPAMIGLPALLLVFLLLNGFYGPILGKFDIWGSEQMPSFFAIRPMATSRFVAIKMRAAAVGVLTTASILFGLCAVWAAVEASPLNSGPSVVLAATARASTRDAIVIVLLLVAVPVVAWRQLTSGIWTSLIGRKWITNLCGIVWMTAVGLAAAAGYWVHHHQWIHSALFTHLPWLIGILVALKVALAAGLIHGVDRYRLIPRRAIAIWLAGSAFACLTLFALLSFWFGPSPIFAAVVFLFFPLTRLAAAPLALHWNRHR